MNSTTNQQEGKKKELPQKKILFRTNIPKSDTSTIPKDVNEMGKEMLQKFTFISDDFGLYEYDHNTYSWNQITEKNLIGRAMTFDTQKFTSTIRRNQTADYVINSVKHSQVQWNKIKPEEIAFRDCLLNILTGERISYLSEMLVNTRLDFNYSPDAECPNWEKAVEGWFEGCPDKKEALREFMAYTLMSHCNWKKAIYLYGKSGCGKSKVFDVIGQMVGGEKNYSAIRLDAMDDPRSLYALKGKRANILPDVSSRSIMADGGWKTVIGGESIQIKKMREDEETYSPIAKHWIGGNNFPQIKDTSDGVYNRLIIVSFDRIFENTKDEDKDLPNKLKKEIPGIINWALKAAKRLIETNGEFTKPKDNAAQIRELSLINNPVREFVEESGLVEKNNNGLFSLEVFCKLFNEYHGFEYGKKWPTRQISLELKNMGIRATDKSVYIKELKKTGRAYIGIQEMTIKPDPDFSLGKKE